MRRALVIGAGLAVAAVAAIALLPASGAPPATPSTLAPRVTSPSLAAAEDAADPAQPDGVPPSSPSTTATEAPAPSTTPPDPPALYDPRRTGEDLPEGYRLTLRRDEIKPIYGPAFIEADKVDWPQDALVIGVAGETEAKAYPVTHLTSREIVNDTLDGSPILVSW